MFAQYGLIEWRDLIKKISVLNQLQQERLLGPHTDNVPRVGTSKNNWDNLAVIRIMRKNKIKLLDQPNLERLYNTRNDSHTTRELIRFFHEAGILNQTVFEHVTGQWWLSEGEFNCFYRFVRLLAGAKLLTEQNWEMILRWRVSEESNQVLQELQQKNCLSQPVFEIMSNLNGMERPAAEGLMQAIAALLQLSHARTFFTPANLSTLAGYIKNNPVKPYVIHLLRDACIRGLLNQTVFDSILACESPKKTYAYVAEAGNFFGRLQQSTYEILVATKNPEKYNNRAWNVFEFLKSRNLLIDEYLAVAATKSEDEFKTFIACIRTLQAAKLSYQRNRAIVSQHPDIRLFQQIAIRFSRQPFQFRSEECFDVVAAAASTRLNRYAPVAMSTPPNGILPVDHQYFIMINPGFSLYMQPEIVNIFLSRNGITHPIYLEIQAIYRSVKDEEAFEAEYLYRLKKYFFGLSALEARVTKPSSMTAPEDILTLPEDIHHEIADQLSPANQALLANTSRYFRDVVYHPSTKLSKLRKQTWDAAVASQDLLSIQELLAKGLFPENVDITLPVMLNGQVTSLLLISILLRLDEGRPFDKHFDAADRLLKMGAKLPELPAELQWKQLMCSDENLAYFYQAIHSHELDILFSFLHRHPQIVLATDQSGCTLLHQLALQAHAITRGQSILYLLCNTPGVNFAATNSDGDTPLHLAAQNFNFDYSNEALPTLISHAEKQKINFSALNNKGFAFLHLLVMQEHKRLELKDEETFQKLLSTMTSAKVDLNVLTADGKTPFLLALQSGHLEMASILLDHGADPTINFGRDLTEEFAAFFDEIKNKLSQETDTAERDSLELDLSQLKFLQKRIRMYQLHKQFDQLQVPENFAELKNKFAVLKACIKQENLSEAQTIEMLQATQRLLNDAVLPFDGSQPITPEVIAKANKAVADYENALLQLSLGQKCFVAAMAFLGAVAGVIIGIVAGLVAGPVIGALGAASLGVTGGTVAKKLARDGIFKNTPVKCDVAEFANAVSHVVPSLS